MAQRFSSSGIPFLLVAALLGAGSCDNSGGGSGGDTLSCGAAECKLIASDAFSDDLFGNQVDVAADVIAVGTPHDDDGGANAGAVYVYRKIGTQWTEEQKLVASDGDASDQFGSAVAADDSSTDGDLIVVGARFHETTGMDKDTDTGAVYVFRFNGTTWTQEQRLLASDVANMSSLAASFGAAVDVEDDLIVVGAFKDNEDGLGSGAAYVFRYSGPGPDPWSQELKLLPEEVLVDDMDPNGPDDPPDPVNLRESDGFGASVSIDKDSMNANLDVIAVGSPRDDVLIQRYDESIPDPSDLPTPPAVIVPNANWARAGTVYMFRSNGGTWPQEDRVIAQRFAYIKLDGDPCPIPGTSMIDPDPDPDVTNPPPIPDVQSTPEPDIRLNKTTPFTFFANDSNFAQFGISVSVDGGRLAVGASRHDRFRSTANPCDIRVTKGKDAGSGYVYRYDGVDSWDFEAQIEVSDSNVKRFIGESIDIDGDTLVISSRSDDEMAQDAGAAYVFRRDATNPLVWVQDQKFVASDAKEDDAFGGAVALDGGTVVAGAEGTSQAGPLTGSAYAFDITP